MIEESLMLTIWWWAVCWEATDGELPRVCPQWENISTSKHDRAKRGSFYTGIQWEQQNRSLPAKLGPQVEVCSPIQMSCNSLPFMLSNPLLLRPFGQVYSKEGASLLAQSVKNLPPVQETWVWSPVRKSSWRREWQFPSSQFQYSCLGDCMDRGAWQATVNGVTKRWTQVSN